MSKSSAEPQPILGGFHVCRPAPIIVPYGEEVGFRLMSDLHIGAAHIDYKLIKKEVGEAVENSDRLMVNGDLLDLILPKDAKRFSPDGVHPRLIGRSDPINAAVEWGVEILGPVAHLIDMIGIGNHEQKTTHWHGVDPTLLLIYELEKIAKAKDPSHVIHYGGYTGFIDYRFRPHTSLDHGCRWVIYYHHGSGAAAPVTKGMIDFNRKDTFIDADLIWMGHKHNRWNGAVEKLSCPMGGDQPSVREVRHVMTGSYFQTYVGQSQESVRRHGRRSNYAADAGLAPQGRGGVRVVIKPLRDKNVYRIQVQVVQ